MFLINHTRPDIAYAVNRLSYYTHNSNKEQWDVLFRLLKYLRDTRYWCLYFNKFQVVLKGFCDANWISNDNKVCSTSGYVFTLCLEVSCRSLPSRLL